MNATDHGDDPIEPLNHAVAVLDDNYLRFTAVKKIEQCILRNAVELLRYRVGNFTLYDKRGWLRNHFYDCFGENRRHLVNIYEEWSYGWDEYDYFENRGDTVPDIAKDRCSIYYLETKGTEVFITPYMSDQDGGLQRIRLCFLDESHAHIRILQAHPISYEITENWIENTGDGPEQKRFKYRVPNDDHIYRPDLQSQLCTIDGLELPTPDLVVSVRLGIGGALAYLWLSIYIKMMWILSTLSLKWTQYRDEHHTDMAMLLWAMVEHIGAIFLIDTKVVYPLGPSGIPPWFLAEAELHQCFGMELRSFQRCVDSFYQCQRRNGR